MWVFTPFGILMPGLRPKHTVPAGDDRLLQVRARRIQDLEILRARYMPGMGDIIRLPHTDYQFRAYCTHEQWAAALAGMAMDIDYVKFKEQTEKKYGDRKLHDLYTKLWFSIFSAFPKGSSYDRPTPKSWSYTTTSYRTPPATQRPTQTDFMSVDDYRDILDDWDKDVPPTLRPSGKMDHSDCDHARTRNARRRCRNRWSK
jgi:hypothetical protein